MGFPFRYVLCLANAPHHKMQSFILAFFSFSPPFLFYPKMGLGLGNRNLVEGKKHLGDKGLQGWNERSILERRARCGLAACLPRYLPIRYVGRQLARYIPLGCIKT